MTKDVVVKEANAIIETPFESVEDTADEFASSGFPEIKIEHGESFFDFNGEKIDKVSGFILLIQKRKSYYAQAYSGEASEPDCSSIDCVKPVEDSNNPQSPTCADCPNNQWGSSSSGKGKACADKRLIHVLVNGFEQVHELKASAMSIKNIDERFVSTVSGTGKYYQYVPVEITAQKVTKIFSIIAIKQLGYVGDDKKITALINKTFSENKEEILKRF